MNRVIISSKALKVFLKDARLDRFQNEFRLRVYCENNKFGLDGIDRTLDIEHKLAFEFSYPTKAYKKLLKFLLLIEEQPLCLEFTDHNWIFIREAIL